MNRRDTLARLYDMADQDITTHLRKILRAQGVERPSLEDCRHLARMVIRSVVPDWAPGSRVLTEEESVTVGAALDDLLGVPKELWLAAAAFLETLDKLRLRERGDAIMGELLSLLETADRDPSRTYAFRDSLAFLEAWAKLNSRSRSVALRALAFLATFQPVGEDRTLPLLDGTFAFLEAARRGGLREARAALIISKAKTTLPDRKESQQ